MESQNTNTAEFIKRILLSEHRFEMSGNKKTFEITTGEFRLMN
jgi:hypothetical protein